MKSKNLALSFLLALAAGLFGCPDQGGGKKKQPPPKVPPAKQATPPTKAKAPPPPAGGDGAASGDVAAGKKLYLTACANCHGIDGTGAMMRKALPKIGNLTSAEMHGRMKDEDIAKLIKGGRNKMPAFGTMFEDEQIKAIIAYVRTMKKG